tara:strand:+ start:44 stop:418 length:375 start_codon:yes stop_codon:yes gene_type:complete
MAHFALLDENNKVLEVQVLNDTVITVDGEENEQLGVDFLVNLHGGGTWKQSKDDGNFRKQAASKLYTYDESNDVFIIPQPYPSWSLDDNYDWQPPIPKPESPAAWNEDTQSWDVYPGTFSSNFT